MEPTGIEPVTPACKTVSKTALKYGRRIKVGHGQVSLIMSRLGIQGLPKRRLPRGARLAKSDSLDLVRRRFTAEAPDRLWMTDITEHPTREGKLYCCAVLDAFSRMVVGYSIDSSQTGLLVTNALGMAIRRREPTGEAIIHSDRGMQFASWVFSQKVRDAGLAPSMGAVGAPFANAMVEAFWARMQVELLNRKRWKTRVELANRALAQHQKTPHRPEHAHPYRIREPAQPTTHRRLIPERRLHGTRVRSVRWLRALCQTAQMIECLTAPSAFLCPLRVRSRWYCAAR
jgi:putative transposase